MPSLNFSSGFVTSRVERLLKPSGSLFSHLSSAYLDKINKDPYSLKEKS